jgi:hypothetical protein
MSPPPSGGVPSATTRLCCRIKREPQEWHENTLYKGIRSPLRWKRVRQWGQRIAITDGRGPSPEGWRVNLQGMRASKEAGTASERGQCNLGAIPPGAGPGRVAVVPRARRRRPPLDSLPLSLYLSRPDRHLLRSSRTGPRRRDWRGKTEGWENP